MNPIIKFRFWSPEENKFIILPRIWVGSDGLLQYEYGEGKELIFQRFTGILDRKDREIYEGDILKTSSENVEVFWDNYNSQFKVVIPGKERYYIGAPLADAISRNAKVIGNIFENKELMDR